MKILCNYPLESFEPRERYSGTEVLTYGPRDRMWVGPEFYPYDIEFDPSRGSLRELLSLMPGGWSPDVLRISYPEHEPVPSGIEDSPFPVIGVVSDWNLHFDQLWGMAPLFDAVLCDRMGTNIFTNAGFPSCHYWPQYTFRSNWHHPREGVERDIDVSFLGNLNPDVQGERIPWLKRIYALNEKISVFIRTGIQGDDYGKILARSKIGFNRSIRREMNLRAFEVCASGALLFMEKENLEVREYLAPGKEVVLYGPDDLEDLIFYFLRHEEERERMAEAGRKKIMDYSMARNLDRLYGIVQGLGRPVKEKPCRWRTLLARGTGMSRTWAKPETKLSVLVQALKEREDLPEAHNAVGAVLGAYFLGVSGLQAAKEFSIAAALDRSYVPPMVNLAYLYGILGMKAKSAEAWEEARKRAMEARRLEDFKGLFLPMRFTAWENKLRYTLALAVLHQDISLAKEVILGSPLPEPLSV